MKTGSALLVTVVLAGCTSARDDSIHVGPRVRTSAALARFASCDALLERLQANYREQMRATILAQAKQLEDSRWYWGPGGAADGSAPTSSAGGMGNAGGTRQEGTNYSGTNNQEAGVDEADFVKTDGYYIYVLNGQSLAILGVPEVGGLEKVSTTALEGWPSQMLVAGDRVAVFSSVYTWNIAADDPLAPYVGREDVPGYGMWWRVPSLVKATVLDVSDRAAPKVVREVYLEGWYQTGREIASTVRMLAYSTIDIPGVKTWIELPQDFWQISPDDPRRGEVIDAAAHDTIAYNERIIDATSLDDFVPLMLTREAGGELEPYSFATNGCTSFAIPDDGTGHGLTSILTLGLFDDELSLEADHVVTNWSTAYASLDTLVVTEPAQDAWWFWDNGDYQEATNVHRFDIGTPGVTTYTGSGRIDGLVQDQFAISEHEGRIRLAATTGQWWRWWETDAERPEPENHVYVLEGDGDLAVIGHLGGIAVGERLWTSRFVGDQAFLVSFQSIDPLWTVDLSDPTDPHIEGELEVPGVSTYIHPLDGGHLLTIGYGTTDQNRVAWGSTQLSLFDVSDFTQPALDAALSFDPPAAQDGWSYAYSQATWEHKAFQFWAPLGLLAIPLSSWRSYQVACPAPDTGWMCYGYQYRSSLELVSVDAAAGTLASYGSIDHSSFYNSDPTVWWYDTEISRSIFMHDDVAGDFVYALSNRGVSVHRITSGLPMVGSVELDGTPNNFHAWGG